MKQQAIETEEERVELSKGSCESFTGFEVPSRQWNQQFKGDNKAISWPLWHRRSTKYATTILLALLALPCLAERHIFLLMGQSNASGMGQEPAPIYQHADRIFVYRNNGQWSPGREPVDEPEGQVDAVSRDAKFGVGFGMAFADAYAEAHPDVEVGLVPCAKGGSTLARWAPHWSRESLYGSCLARALEASGEGKIAGVLWWQGEDESATTAPVWGVNFASMVRALRVDLGNLDLPVVYARIRGATSVTAVTRAQQDGIVGRLAFRVSTDGIEYPDGWHPNTDGYQVVGRRMAEVLP